MLTKEEMLVEYNVVVAEVRRAEEILRDAESLSTEEKYRAVEQAQRVLFGSGEE